MAKKIVTSRNSVMEVAEGDIRKWSWSESSPSPSSSLQLAVQHLLVIASRRKLTTPQQRLFNTWRECTLRQFDDSRVQLQLRW